MGKYRNSKIHELFSDWHRKYCKPGAVMTDIDRLWMELRNGKPKAICDLKFDDRNRTTKTEKSAYNWFRKNEVPVYIQKWPKTKKWSEFKNAKRIVIINFETGISTTVSQRELIDWINNDFEDDIFD